MKPILTAIRKRVLRFRRELIVVGYAIRHPATPLHLRLLGLLLFAYLASPLDLIPIVIPVLGVVDDLLLVPWGMSVVVGRLPAPARADAETSAERFLGRWVKRPLLYLAGALLLLALLWVALGFLVWRVWLT